MTLAPLAPIYGRPAYEIVDGCWLWRGAKNSKGYAIRGSKAEGKYLVHRRVYENAHGPLEAGLEVHHRCGNPSCVRLAHLRAQTTASHRAAHGHSWLLQAVLAVLAEGPTRYRELVWAAKDAGATSDSTISALQRLVDRGEVIRLERGLYALPSENTR